MVVDGEAVGDGEAIVDAVTDGEAIRDAVTDCDVVIDAVTDGVTLSPVVGDAESDCETDADGDGENSPKQDDGMPEMLKKYLLQFDGKSVARSLPSSIILRRPGLAAAVMKPVGSITRGLPYKRSE